MKNTKKFLVALSATLIAGLSAGGFAACKDDDDSLKIRFETNGASSIAEITAEAGNQYTLPQPAAREGYEFGGWYDNASFEGAPITQITMGESSVTYYAKWIKLAAITLNLDGGSLEKSVLYLKEGASVAEFMANYTPTKQGLIFGAWFDGDQELAANKKMPADGLTLTAKYKVEYTIQLMLETMAGGEYEKTEVKKSDYVGMSVTIAEAPEGFTEFTHDDTHKTGTLSANSAENVFTQYFNRNSYTLTFRPNYPADSEGSDDSKVIEGKFGMEFEVPSNYSCMGYVLAGWSLSVNGDVEYKTNHIERSVFNADGEELPEAAKMQMLGKDASLYAVWKKGYTDMFSGEDVIFFLDDAEEGTTKDIYLSRGNKFFSGTYYIRQEVFEFQMQGTTLSGKLYDGDVFTYSSSKRDEAWNALFDNGELQEDTRVDFDKYNGIKYTEKDEKGFLKTSEGTYIIDEDGYYVANFTSGDLEGKSLTFIIGTVTVEGATRNAFQIRKDNEIELGEIVGYKVSGKTLVEDSNAYTVVLNGFGVATCRKGGTQSTYYYTIDDDIITIESRYGATVLVGRLTKADGKNVYFAYDETVDGNFLFGNGDSVSLNGSHEAVYTRNGVAENGLFTVVGTSAFGGSIVDVRIGDNTYRMTVKTRDEKVLEDGEIVTKTHYEAENELDNYGEYFYLNNGLVYYAPMIVLDEEKKGEATLYGMDNKTNEYILASRGTYTKMDGVDKYIYTASTWYDCSKMNSEPFDLSKLKVIVFNIDTDATDYSLSYWYSSANGDSTTTGETIEYSSTYTSTKADGATLVLVSGYAFYKDANEMTYEGAYSVKEGIMTVFAGKSSYYFAIDEENYKFTALEYEPYKGYFAEEDGEISESVYLKFDGMGKAIYTVVTSFDDNNEELEKTETLGTVAKTKLTTDYNREIWEFTSNDGSLSFKYIVIEQSAGSIIIRQNETYQGEFTSKAGRLTLDGYIYGAKFIDADKNEYEGIYFVIEENVVQLYVQNKNGGAAKYFYFDISGKSFTVRGEEYGEYLITENQYGNTYVELNGYGKLSVYTKTEVEGEEEPKKTYIAKDGTYAINGDTYTLTYAVDGVTKTLVGQLGTAFTEDGQEPGFLVYNEQKEYTFIDESDWSMIVLDDFGNAVRYDKEGIKEEGKFTVVDDDLIYYTSKTRENSMIYNYDLEKGTIKKVEKLTQVAYYTANLESLLFTEYGFAVFNGTQTYYYRVDASNNVLIYRQDPTAKAANEYGFVLENFGKFDETKEWTISNVTKSYIKNDGWSIGFSRSDGKTTGGETTYPYPVATKSDVKHPLKDLKFQPSDEAEFEVSGTVDYGGVTTQCTVVREIIDSKTGEAQMYVSLKGYAYRFYIEVEYTGDVNTYKVVKMTLEREIPSYNFLYSYYVYAMFYGQKIENDIGTVYIHGSYDEEGEKQEFYMTAEFLSGSEFKGVDDEILAFEKGTYDLNDSVYSTTFTATDGEKYSLHFQTATVMGSVGYRVAALTRFQTITFGEYTVEVSNIIYTEASNFEVGDVYLHDLTLYKNGELLEKSNIFMKDNAYYYVEQGEGVATHYQITLKEKGSSLEDDGIPSYVGAEVTAERATTKVAEKNDKLSVDISDETGKVLMIRLFNEDVYAQDSTYDAATKIYTVTTTGGDTYYVKLLDNGKVDIADAIADLA